MKRYLEDQIIADLNQKMVFVAGPRQSGKTTLAKKISASLGGQFLNYDIEFDRTQILSRELKIKSGLIAFDELHKYSRWRNYLKSLYDQHLKSLKILVTGSAKLDHYRKGGDSLQGRYHLLHLFPLSYAELKMSSQGDLDTLFNLGWFPEPFFSGSLKTSKRWSREYRSLIIYHEISSVEKVKDLALLEELSLRLPELVSSTLSINSLREDLSIAHETVDRWINILESLYSIFLLPTFTHSRIKSLKKEKKHYLIDWTLVEDKGSRFENFIACHLLKWCKWMTDTEGDEYRLCFYRDREGREVDFIVTKNQKPIKFMEAKFSEKNASSSLIYLKKKYPDVECFQVLYSDKFHFTNKDGIEIIPARVFLKNH